MKTYFGLRQDVMNGTVLLKSDTSAYTTAELRSMVIAKLKEQNEKFAPEEWTIRYTEFEMEVFENSSEVPIMNESNKTIDNEQSLHYKSSSNQ